MAKRRNDARPVATPATPATRAADEWGLPDWRDPEAYGDWKRWTFNRWRWEFYRRRDDLRAYFDAHADEAWRIGSVRLAGSDEPLRPEEPGFTTLQSAESLERFAYARVPNPRIGDQPAHCIRTDRHPGVNCITGGGHILHGGGQPLGSFLKLALFRETDEWIGNAINWSGIAIESFSFDEARIQAGDEEQGRQAMRDGVLSRLAECQAISLNPNELALTFDLDQPLESQLEHAREILRWYQTELHGKTIGKKMLVTKWRDYLRTLDAREDGASWNEIAGIHPNTAQTPQTARDIWKAANALRFNF